MSVVNKIIFKINTQPQGWVCSAIDFIDLGTRDAIDKALSRLAIDKILRRVAVGLYDCPINHPLFGDMPTDLTQVAQAWARKFGYTLQLSPAHAANFLGLSNQVPAHIVYLTDGPSKVMTIGNQTIQFMHVAAKKLLGAGTKIGLVMQALYYFGKSHLTRTIIDKIIRLLQSDDKQELKNVTPLCPLWMQPILRDMV